MSALEIIHLAAVSLWAGIVLVELLIEAVGSVSGENHAHRITAKLHFWTDVLFEIPVIGVVLVSGAALAAHAWSLSALLQVKIACGLLAIAFNTYCIVYVVLRHRDAHDPLKLMAHRKRVLMSGAGLPFGVVAAYLGFRYFV